jgi:hypothetical protein
VSKLFQKKIAGGFQLLVIKDYYTAYLPGVEELVLPDDEDPPFVLLLCSLEFVLLCPFVLVLPLFLLLVLPLLPEVFPLGLVVTLPASLLFG